MPAARISFYYEEEKIKILKKEAEGEDRTTSNYVQNVLKDHIALIDNPILEEKRNKI